MSETCPILTNANLKPHMLELDKAEQAHYRCRTGLPIPSVKLAILDPEGKELPHDGKATGEVVVRTPWLTQGYFKDPERSEELWADGWLHTGDIGFIDEDGYLQITDRLKDVIKTGGEWVSSLELESMISQHQGVSEVAVIGVPDPKWGERPMALIVPKDNFRDTLSQEDIITFLLKSVEEGTIPKYAVPGQILIVDTIAKTSVGKLNKKVLRKEYSS
jgi:fatty-acyl-CoA synthase